MTNLVEDVKNYVAEVISSNSTTKADDIKLSAYAANRNIGVRTVQRRLVKSNTTYKDIRDAVRKEKVIGLAELGLSTLLITKALGYRERKQTEKCFKRWFGMTLPQYRATFKTKYPANLYPRQHYKCAMKPAFVTNTIKLVEGASENTDIICTELVNGIMKLISETKFEVKERYRWSVFIAARTPYCNFLTGVQKYLKEKYPNGDIDINVVTTPPDHRFCDQVLYTLKLIDVQEKDELPEPKLLDLNCLPILGVLKIV